MYYFFILPVLILYPLLTYKITREVWKKTKSKRFTIITLAVFLLIPTWDVVIGYGIFLYKWATWSGTKIYKTVEAKGRRECITKEHTRQYRRALQLKPGLTRQCL